MTEMPPEDKEAVAAVYKGVHWPMKKIKGSNDVKASEGSACSLHSSLFFSFPLSSHNMSLYLNSTYLYQFHGV